MASNLHWKHFERGNDVRGFGWSRAAAFEQAAVPSGPAGSGRLACVHA